MTATVSTPVVTMIAPMNRAARSPAGHRRSSVIAAATIAIAPTFMTPTTSKIAIRPAQHDQTGSDWRRTRDRRLLHLQGRHGEAEREDDGSDQRPHEEVPEADQCGQSAGSHIAGRGCRLTIAPQQNSFSAFNRSRRAVRHSSRVPTRCFVMAVSSFHHDSGSFVTAKCSRVASAVLAKKPG